MNRILETLAKGWGIDPDHPSAEVDCLNKGLSVTKIEKQLINERKTFTEKELKYTSKIVRLENIEKALIELIKDEGQINAARLKKQFKSKGIAISYEGDPHLNFKPE